MIEMQCPKCRLSLTIPDQYEGQEGRCAGCRELFVVPIQARVQPEDHKEVNSFPAIFIPDNAVTQLEVLPSRAFEEEERRLWRMSRISEGVYCRGCGTVIHKSARACPQCGALQRGGRPGKSKATAVILALFLGGGIGLHRFYLGQWWWGIWYLLFCWTYIPMVIALFEGVAFLCSSRESWDAKYGG